MAPMQMLVLPSSGGFTPVAPMRFTSQLTLPFLATGCSLTMLENPPQLCNGLNLKSGGKHFWDNFQLYNEGHLDARGGIKSASSSFLLSRPKFSGENLIAKGRIFNWTTYACILY